MKTILKYLKWLYAHSKGVRRRLVLNVALGVVSIALNLLFIWLCKRIVDIATGDFAGSIALYTGIVIGVTVLRLAVNALNMKVETLTSSRMNFIIRKNLYSNLMQAEWLGKERHHSGDMINRLETDVSTVTGVICSDFPQLSSPRFSSPSARSSSTRCAR